MKNNRLSYLSFLIFNRTQTDPMRKTGLADGKDEADPYLIAYCKVHGFKLISDEKKFVSNKIPEVAKKNDVHCINLYDFFEERGLKMVRKNGE